MRVRYTRATTVSLTSGKAYDVISIEGGWFRIMDDTGEDYLFPPDSFEIIETNPHTQE